ncbi:MAG: ribonuclease E/G, partial [candidate division Zixibacteria bacterium]|nr:ribonuclease E/G [candidate division Zixibacteria bacterium]
MKRELLINISDYETRVALLEEDRLVEMVVERPDTERMVGDIYKGRINRVLPGLQAAFIEIGWEKAAFLHSSDMGSARESQERFEVESDADDDSSVEIIRKRRYATIESVLTEGQDLLVQVIKEPIGSKGPRVSTDISIPGRYLVLVPDSDRTLVSRKISDWGERKRLRKIVSSIRPEGFGLICRTESEGKGEKDFLPDIKRLLKMWRLLQRSAERSEAPALIHKEEKLTTSVVRDIFNDSVDRCLVDDRREYRRLAAYARQVAPHLKDRIEFHKGDTPLFDLYNLEPEIEKMLEDEMKKQEINSKIQKIILSLQNLRGKPFLIGTIFISMFGLLNVQIDLSEMKITEFEKKSLF